MKQYKIQCESAGCGEVLGTLELPDHQPLTNQHQGYLCQDCGKKLSSQLSSRQDPPYGLSPEKLGEFEQFRSKIASKDKVDLADIDQLVKIFFAK